ncbi:PD-(D/E)XK nuclease family protein [Flexithrix dorotheae]|uniref:PD-(D/E)XK nuclease family protein n=1 Tax=Flexithrix dorotheae TaxID=70993 RepID=UPI00036EC82C|nr:PD-(D/E)XK nuclease family protein [Flexithrix dorotheae]
MTPFLKEVAQDLYNKFGGKISRIHVVLPSRRAGLYFKYYLAEIANQNLIAPEVMAMDDFILSVCGVQVVDRVKLLFELYRSYKIFDKDKDHNLEKFIPLGNAMLKDFSMIDKNLSQSLADSLFEHLEEVKAIERWALELGEDLEVKESSTLRDYFVFWENLKNTYRHFREKLLSQKQAYTGLAYRVVYENLEQTLRDNEIEHIAFAGFNQITIVEEQMIGQLIDMKMGTAYWDMDNYYLQNEKHEAGLYIRKFLKNWLPGIEGFVNNSVNSPEKNIRIINVNNAISQTKLVGDLLAKQIKSLTEKGEFEAFKESINHTAILLPDETLLMPLLHSLPSEEDLGINIGELVNVTMGMSINNTPLYTLIDALFRMQENIRKKEDDFQIYYKDVLKIIKHPFVQFYGDKQEEHLKVQNQVQSGNIIYISRKWLLEQSKEDKTYDVLFRFWEGELNNAFDHLFEVIELLSGQFKDKKDALENEFLYQFFTTLKRLQDVLTSQNEKLTIKTFKQFLFELIKNVKVPFTGEPISPIQVMGMLESRAIDFENIIILSANEGLLPHGKVLDSIVPFDIRAMFKLPTHKENDASFAYTFYRLFHKAKNITLMYTDPSAGGGAEKSRFLTQIEEEFGFQQAIAEENASTIIADLPGLPRERGKLFKNQLVLDLPESSREEKVVEKDGVILDLIKAVLKKGLSPSAINLYIKDTLAFFFKSILKLEEAAEIEEDLDRKTFGTVIHETLDLFFKNKIGQFVEKEDLQEIISHPNIISETIEQVIKEKIGGIVTEQGKNYILKKVAERLILNYLKRQQESAAPFYLVDQERFYRHTIKVTLKNGEVVPFCISGKADRIDIIDNQIRIVDYKTGTYNKSKLKADQILDLFFEPEKEKIVQLVLYKYLLIKTIEKGEIEHLPDNFDIETFKIQSGFYFFRNLGDDFVAYSLKEEPYKPADFCVYVENFLQNFVIDLLDPENPFSNQPSEYSNISKETNI